MKYTLLVDFFSLSFKFTYLFKFKYALNVSSIINIVLLNTNKYLIAVVKMNNCYNHFYILMLHKVAFSETDVQSTQPLRLSANTSELI